MRKLIAHLLLMLSILAMPFGMQSIAAASSHQPHASASMPMPMQHCPDREDGKGGLSGIAECTMVCSAALPAVSTAPPEARRINCEPPRTIGTKRLDSIQPDTVTPPPKAS